MKIVIHRDNIEMEKKYTSACSRNWVVYYMVRRKRLQVIWIVYDI